MNMQKQISKRSEDILPKNRRLNRMQLTVLENGIIRHPASALGNVPTLVEYYKALEAAEEAEEILVAEIKRVQKVIQLIQKDVTASMSGIYRLDKCMLKLTKLDVNLTKLLKRKLSEK